jgi:arginase
MDFGQGRRGVDMGPSAIRYAGLRDGIELIGHVIHESGNVGVPIPEMCRSDDPRMRNVDCVVPVARGLMEQVASGVQEGHFPIVLGGDHSLSLGSVRGAAEDRKLGLIWVDAHGDFNTHETTPTWGKRPRRMRTGQRSIRPTLRLSARAILTRKRRLT